MALLVCTALFGLAGLTVFSYSQIERVFTAANFASENSVPALIAVDKAVKNFGQVRVRLYRHVLNSDATKIASYEKELDASRTALAAALKEYEPTITDAEDRRLFNANKAALAAYEPGIEPVLALSRANKKDQAKDALNGLTATGRVLQDALDAQVKYNIDLARKSVDDAVEIKRKALIQSAAIAVTAFLMTAVMGFFITRNLMNQLGGEPDEAADIANKIAVGDLSSQIHLKPGDTASVFAAMKNMSDTLKGLLADTDVLVKAAAEGALDTRADASKYQGDFRKLVQGINDTLDGVIDPVNEAVEVLKEMEQGNLTQTVNGDYKGQLKDFKDTVNNTIAKLSQVIGEVNAAASNIAGASEEVSATAQNMSHATSEQAASVEETSASVEQMSASINQNTENAKVTDGMATQASGEAVQGGEAVRETVGAMKSIAGKIGIIDDIAYQTNLLALNAAIEAARAGEHGRGFAVVAAEVRKLAERSQIAAQEIGELAESSVDMAESAGKLLDTIVPSIKKTSDLVQEIAAASEEQSAGVGQINTAMDQLNQITQQNASSSEELAATSEEMSGQAAQLQELMAFFTVGDSAGALFKAPNVKPFKPAIKKAVIAKQAPNEAEFVRF
ncbi:methyl-accepting chemotaxis sensory transducer [Methylobacter tundripaludum SV96]|uniref:Methyl-accepting chemotaxis sensory transducer n=2 Tax=Methylobacter tundripaludum TaxID=173365 RepID=G3IVF3_METTV|nr:methyl-accepting chemotaxis sensory transducer [Methylobacter tundripaludum SV96]